MHHQLGRQAKRRNKMTALRAGDRNIRRSNFELLSLTDGENSIGDTHSLRRNCFGHTEYKSKPEERWISAQFSFHCVPITAGYSWPKVGQMFCNYDHRPLQLHSECQQCTKQQNNYLGISWCNSRTTKVQRTEVAHLVTSAFWQLKVWSSSTLSTAILDQRNESVEHQWQRQLPATVNLLPIPKPNEITSNEEDADTAVCNTETRNHARSTFLCQVHELTAFSVWPVLDNLPLYVYYRQQKQKILSYTWITE